MQRRAASRRRPLCKAKLSMSRHVRAVPRVCCWEWAGSAFIKLLPSMTYFQAPGIQTFWETVLVASKKFGPSTQEIHKGCLQPGLRSELLASFSAWLPGPPSFARPFYLVPTLWSILWSRHPEDSLSPDEIMQKDRLIVFSQRFQQGANLLTFRFQQVSLQLLWVLATAKLMVCSHWCLNWRPQGWQAAWHSFR